MSAEARRANVPCRFFEVMVTRAHRMEPARHHASNTPCVLHVDPSPLWSLAGEYVPQMRIGEAHGQQEARSGGRERAGCGPNRRRAVPPTPTGAARTARAQPSATLSTHALASSHPRPRINGAADCSALGATGAVSSAWRPPPSSRSAQGGQRAQPASSPPPSPPLAAGSDPVPGAALHRCCARVLLCLVPCVCSHLHKLSKVAQALSHVQLGVPGQCAPQTAVSNCRFTRRELSPISAIQRRDTIHHT